MSAAIARAIVPGVPAWALLAGLVAGRAGAQAPVVFVATRDLQIDAATADIGRAGSMLIARDGQILVIDDNDNIFRTFDASGPTGTIGRQGEGPGEFKNLRSAGWLGDSLWVYDPDLARVTIFGPNHKYARSFPAPATITSPSAPGDTANVSGYVQAVLPDGSLRMVTSFRPGHAPGWAVGLDTAAWLDVRTTAAGVLRNRVMIAPPDRCRVDGMHGTTPWAAYIQFCDSRIITDWVETPTSIAARVDLESADGKAPSYRVRVVDESGTVRIDRSYPFVPVVVSKAALDSSAAAREKLYARMGPAYADFAKKLAPAKNYPPIRRIVNGRDGTIWLEERVRQPGHHWKILDARGDVTGTIVLPDNVALQAADVKTIWAYETDADGLPGIVRYHLDRGKS